MFYEQNIIRNIHLIWGACVDSRVCSWGVLLCVSYVFWLFFFLIKPRSRQIKDCHSLSDSFLICAFDCWVVKKCVLAERNSLQQSILKKTRINTFLYVGKGGKIPYLPHTEFLLLYTWVSMWLRCISEGRSESQITAGFLDRTLCGYFIEIQFNRQGW